MEALGRSWHARCFVCAACAEPFDDGVFVAREGEPDHRTCYADAFGPKCAGCGKGLAGKHIVVEGAKYHAACFVCAECGGTLGGGFGPGPDGRPYCKAHVADAFDAGDLAVEADSAAGPLAG